MAKKEIIPPGIDKSSPAALREYRPTTYARIIQSLSEGVGIRKIAKACGIGTALVYEVAREEKLVIQGKKAELAGKLHQIAAKSATLVYEDLDQCSPRDASIIMGISIEKALLLEGEPGQIVEHRVVTAPRALTEVMEAAATVIDSTPEPGAVIGGDFSGSRAVQTP